MSNFYCPHCGALCENSSRGYTSGCEHFPPDINKGGFPVKNRRWHRRQYKKAKKIKDEE